jgi:hypothetical protein
LPHGTGSKAARSRWRTRSPTAFIDAKLRKKSDIFHLFKRMLKAAAAAWIGMPIGGPGAARGWQDAKRRLAEGQNCHADCDQSFRKNFSRFKPNFVDYGQIVWITRRTAAICGRRSG